jgi:hypothetical protein
MKVIQNPVNNLKAKLYTPRTINQKLIAENENKADFAVANDSIKQLFW